MEREQQPLPEEQQQQQNNGPKKSNRSPPYALFNLLVIVVAILYGAYYQMYLSEDAKGEASDKIEITGEDELQKIQLFTPEELAVFNGIRKCSAIN
jgi:hypothetical protein